MNYQQYFDFLMQQCHCDLDIQLIVNEERMFKPYQIVGNTLILNSHANGNLYAVIEEFFIYEVVLNMHIKTERIEIDNHDEKYLDDFYKLASNKKIAYLEATVPVQSKEEAKQRIKQYQVSGKGIYYNGHLIGWLSLVRDYARASIGYEIGYSIYEDYWRQGFAYEALSALIPYIFEYTPIDILSARTLLENEASIKLLEKLDFSLEGIRKRSLYHPYTEEIVDTIVYSRVKE